MNEDKNNDECLNCKDRVAYVNNIGRCLSSSMPLETVRDPEIKKMDDKKLCKKCSEKPAISKFSPYCSPCLNSFKTVKKKAPEVLKKKKAGSDKAKPEKARKTANAAVVIEFGKYDSILNEVKNLANDQMRPLDMQILFMLKKQLDHTEGG